MFGQMPPVQMSPVWSEQFPQPSTPPKPRGGMFGGGGSWQNALLAAVAGLMARHNPMAAQMIVGQLKSGLDAKREDQQYQRQRQDKRDDFTFEQDYRAQHQAPDDFTQLMQSAGVDPQSEQGRGLYMQYLQNKANPFTQMRVQNPDGSESLQFMRPPSVPAAPVGQLQPYNPGGPVPQAPGGFPY